jgi:ribosome biogenesis GTPase
MIAKIKGKEMYMAKSREDYPAVGDWVAVAYLDDGHAVIERIMPRKSLLRRKMSGGVESQVIAANVDTVFIVQAVDRDFNINRIERYAAMVVSGGAVPSVALSKADLIPEQDVESYVSRIRGRLPNTDVIAVSSVNQHGLVSLRHHLVSGKTYCFIGSSGVGKSSIVNNLLGRQALAVKEIGEKSGRGKHATTVRMLFILDNGAIVIDNPGMREFGVLGGEQGIADIFERISDIALSCKFTDCMHSSERGCAVRAAIEAGAIDAEQFESYQKLRKEDAFHDMSALERRRKDRAFGTFIKKALSHVEKYK